MNDSRNPEAQGQKRVEQHRTVAAAQKHGRRRANHGDEIAHGVALSASNSGRDDVVREVIQAENGFL